MGAAEDTAFVDAGRGPRTRGAGVRVAATPRERVAVARPRKRYRQMYANTGIATDSARVQRSAQRSLLIATSVRRLFLGKPMPDLQMPQLRRVEEQVA